MSADHRSSRKAGRPASSPSLHWNPRPLALALALVGTSASAQLPTGFNPVQGSVLAPVTSGGAMSIQQQSDRAIIEWGSFSIGKDNAVRFLQPGASSIALNRVVGGELSQIMGTLSANGRIFLINPAGVLFGQGSRVDTGGLIASTLSISNDDFMAGRFRFERDDANTAAVTNLGTLTAPGSTIALMAATVVNGPEGKIVADGGTVGLVSARQVSLDFQGDGLTTFRFEPDTAASMAAVTNENGGLLQANGGRVAVLADSSQAAQRVVNQQGTIRALSMSTRNGEIVLGASGQADVEAGGTLDVSGAAGGSLRIEGGGIRTASAQLDASGDSGGGSIVLDARRAVTLDAGSALRADARVAGNGGTILVQGPGVHAAGTMTATAAGGGAGGAVTTSGAVVEVEAAHVSAAGAGGGPNGKWTIASQGDVTIGAAPAARPDTEVSAANDGSRVSDRALGEALGRGTDVTVSATGFPLDGRAESGNVQFEENASVVKSQGGASTLHVDAMRNLRMGEGSRIESQAGALHVEFNADSSGAAAQRRPGGSTTPEQESGGSIELSGAAIVTRGGDLRLYGQSDADNGHASGGSSFVGGEAYLNRDGIAIDQSTISLCADAACAAGGSLTLAGEGMTTVNPDSSQGVRGGVGVRIDASDVDAGGNIAVTGRGGVAAAGVRIDGLTEGGSEGRLTAGGNIAITGTAQAATLDDNLPERTPEAGVLLRNTRVAAGGDVSIDGQGSNLDVLTQSPDIFGPLGYGTIGAVDGVHLSDTVVLAGPRRDILIAGTAGGDGLAITSDGASGAIFTPIAAQSVRIEKSVAALEAPGGTAPDIATDGGRIRIVGRAGNVWLAGEPTKAGVTLQVDAGSAAGQGGSVEVSGRNVGVLGATALLADGAAGGGTVTVQADAVAAVDDFARVRASSTGANGDGGSILLTGNDGLRVHGSLQARGTGGGHGGTIETSGAGVDAQGVRVDAGAAGGTAGSWIVDPYDVSIVHGTGPGLPVASPFEAVADTTIQDSSINGALDAGTNVRIGTGGGTGTGGDITIDSGVDIRRTTGAAPLEFALDAHRSIRGESFSITSEAGALDLAFNSNAGGTLVAQQSIDFTNASLATNGGSVSLFGQSDPVAGSASSNDGPAIHLVDSVIDTRVGQADTGAGGNAVLRGAGDGTTGVAIEGGRIDASTGSVTVRGVSSNAGMGVEMLAGSSGEAIITTTAGDVVIVGVGGSDSSLGAEGVRLEGAHVQSGSGTVDVRGLAQGPGTTAAGVVIETSSLVAQGGRVLVAGQSEGGGAGIDLQGGSSSLSSHAIDGAQGVILRADNDGSADAIALGASVNAGTAINLRPGGVDAAGNAADHVATAVSVAGAGGAGFSLSDADLANLHAPDVVIGSNAHAADISVDGAVAMGGNLTLQNEGGGAIALNGSVAADTLALLAGGNVTQSAAATIAANALTVRSAAGNVLLNDAGNAVATVAGGAAGDFRYTDTDGLSIGDVAALGMDAATNAVQSRALSGIAADRAIVQARSGDIAADAAIAAPTAVTLQADAGAIRVNQAVQSGTVALLAGGAIGQQAGAAITAGTLVARSTGAGVTLTDAGNQAATLAGGAATDFRYVDRDGLIAGNAAFVRHDGTGALQADTVSGVAAGITQLAARTGDLNVAAAVAATDLLSLQADAGAIALGGAVQGRTVALLADGNIVQAASGAIAGDALLARSATGDIALAAGANNVRALAASAAGDLRYRGAGDLAVATVTAGSLGASGAPQAVATAGVTAGDAVVQAATGNLAVQAASSAARGLTLDAAGNLDIGQGVQGRTVALLAGGNIDQSAAGGLSADALLVRAGGAADLVAAGNDVRTLAGAAAGDLRYRGSGDLGVAAVTAGTVDTAGAPRTVAGAGVAGSDVVVQTTSGNLSIGAASAAAGGLTLQADSGNVTLGQAVQGTTVALLAGRDVTQSAAGGVGADALLAQAAGGRIDLTAGSNDVRSLAAAAEGDVGYRGAGDLALAGVSAGAQDAGGAARTVSGAGVAGRDVIVQATSGNLAVRAGSAAARNLVLQADAGNVQLDQSLGAAAVALLAGGDIGQSGAGTITADQLLARSTGGSVGLDQAANRVATVAGGASTAFAYTNEEALRIGAVSLPTPGAAASGIGAAATVVRTLNGDLTLDADVTGGTADLVAAARFQNPHDARIDTSGQWRVWADTWAGETRGGMAGSGTLPNLYGRSYGGAAVADPGNHFIYRQQPTVTVTLDSAARPAGMDNPALGYTLSGLILGDGGAGISGTVGSAATAGSPAGTYAVTATTPFVSAEGYLINVVPGVLTVNSYALPSMDVQREIPTTYLYDRNLAPVAMCFATGPIAGDRVEQAGDVLAREWSRVRSRPNLSNCVATDRRNACSDF